jgi:hypothetical protein
VELVRLCIAFCIVLMVSKRLYAYVLTEDGGYGGVPFTLHRRQS